MRNHEIRSNKSKARSTIIYAICPLKRNTTEKQQSNKSVGIDIYPTGKRAL